MSIAGYEKKINELEEQIEKLEDQLKDMYHKNTRLSLQYYEVEKYRKKQDRTIKRYCYILQHIQKNLGLEGDFWNFDTFYKKMNEKIESQKKEGKRNVGRHYPICESSLGYFIKDTYINPYAERNDFLGNRSAWREAKEYREDNKWIY